MKRKLLTLLMVIMTIAAHSNDPKPAPIPSLNEQYKNLKSDLELINGFRMIKMYTMDRFWTVVNDSLKTQRAKIDESTDIIAQQHQKINTLELSIGKLKGEKSGLETRVDNMVVFGKTYSKAGVITTAVLTIIGLLVVTGILFSISRISLATTRELRKLNENLYNEFDNYKRQAVEKEIKLSRELQNFRNRVEELKTA